MKRLMIILLCIAALTALVSLAGAEPLGFGVISGADATLRKEPGGEQLLRLPEGSSVWIRESRTDGERNLWYAINAESGSGETVTNVSGWIKAESVDAGSRIWHDVCAVEARHFGMIALRTDGTAAAAGSHNDGSLQAWAAGLRDIRQVSLSPYGWEYCALDGSGTVRRSGGIDGAGRLRLICGSGEPYGITEDNRLQTGRVIDFAWFGSKDADAERISHAAALAENGFRLLLLTDDGEVYAGGTMGSGLGYPEPAWKEWTNAAAVDAAAIRLVPGGEYEPAFAAVRKDGTVLAAPDGLAALIGSWQDMKKVAVSYYWVVGLKQDGTVVTAGPEGADIPDVSGWTGITDIANGQDYCVGVREDGSLVFAGNHVFGN